MLCCSFHFVAPFFLLSYFTMGSSAGHSPFRVVPLLCSCLGQLVCPSVSAALLALLPWHFFCFSLTAALVSLLHWHRLLCLLRFSASLVLWHLSCRLPSVCPFNVYCPFLCICYCRGAICSSGSVLMCSGSIFSIAEPLHSAVLDLLLHVTTAAPSLPKPHWFYWIQVSRLQMILLVFLDKNSKGKAFKDRALA